MFKSYEVDAIGGIEIEEGEKFTTWVQWSSSISEYGFVVVTSWAMEIHTDGITKHRIINADSMSSKEIDDYIPMSKNEIASSLVEYDLMKLDISNISQDCDYVLIGIAVYNNTGFNISDMGTEEDEFSKEVLSIEDLNNYVNIAGWGHNKNIRSKYNKSIITGLLKRSNSNWSYYTLREKDRKRDKDSVYNTFKIKAYISR